MNNSTIAWKSLAVAAAGLLTGAEARAQLLDFRVIFDNVVIIDNDPTGFDSNPVAGVIGFDSLTWGNLRPTDYWARGRVVATASVTTGASIIGDVRIQATTAAGAGGLMSFQSLFTSFVGGHAEEWARGYFDDAIPGGVPLVNRAGFDTTGRFDGITMPRMVVGPVIDQFPSVPFDVARDQYMGVLGGNLQLDTNWGLGAWDVVDWPLGITVVPSPPSLALLSLGLLAMGRRCRAGGRGR